MLAEPRQYCEHSTLGTAQHSRAAAAALLLLQGVEAPSPQLVGGGEGGRHCGPTEQLHAEAAGGVGAQRDTHVKLAIHPAQAGHACITR